MNAISTGIFVIKKLSRQVSSFSIIGSIGFLVDGSVLTFFSMKVGLNIYVSRIISFTLASLATWLLNRRFTFTKPACLPGSSLTREYIRYAVIQIGGAMINLGIFTWLITQNPALQSMPIIPLSVGAGVALVFNFLGARIWVYHEKRGY